MRHRGVVLYTLEIYTPLIRLVARGREGEMYRGRLQRLAVQIAPAAEDDGSSAAVESPLAPGSLKFEKMEQNRSGDPKVSQGFGRVSQTQPPKFRPDQHDEIVEFFNREGFAVIIGALSQDEVDHLNGFFSRTQADPHWRRAWGLGDVRAGYHQNQGLIYSQPLLDHPELDKYTQHPSNYPVVCELLGGEDKPRFAEFNFREAPEGAGQRAMNFHHDAALPGRIQREPYGPPDWVCAIHCKQCTNAVPRVLKRSSFIILVAFRPDGRQRKHTRIRRRPAFCAPQAAAGRVREPARLLRAAALWTRGDLRPLRHRMSQHAASPAQTHHELAWPYSRWNHCWFVQATYHTRLDGKDDSGKMRRTVHQYYARGSWAEDGRGPTPPLTDWNVFPKRLAASEDPDKRRFFSHWNTAMCEWAASDWSDEVRAKMPRGYF